MTRDRHLKEANSRYSTSSRRIVDPAARPRRTHNSTYLEELGAGLNADMDIGTSSNQDQYTTLSNPGSYQSNDNSAYLNTRQYPPSQYAAYSTAGPSQSNWYSTTDSNSNSNSYQLSQYANSANGVSSQSDPYSGLPLQTTRLEHDASTSSHLRQTYDGEQSRYGDSQDEVVDGLLESQNGVVTRTAGQVSYAAQQRIHLGYTPYDSAGYNYQPWSEGQYRQ